jgi:hypothetical protein
LLFDFLFIGSAFTLAYHRCSLSGRSSIKKAVNIFTAGILVQADGRQYFPTFLQNPLEAT